MLKANIIDDLDEDPENVILGLNKRNQEIFDPYRVNIKYWTNGNDCKKSR